MIAAMVGTALALTVSAPVPAASAAVNVGSITGVVKDTGGVLLAGIVVSVIDLTGYGEVVVDEDVTDAAGAYRVDDIWADPYYKVRFSDPAGDHATEFFADEVSGVFATWVPVTAGGLTSGVDASLEPGGSISGRLTVHRISRGVPRPTSSSWTPNGLSPIIFPAKDSKRTASRRGRPWARVKRSERSSSSRRLRRAPRTRAGVYRAALPSGVMCCVYLNS